MPDSEALRKLAAWYREFAERAGDPAIWAKRLRTAKELEAEADDIDAQQAAKGYRGSALTNRMTRKRG